MNWTTPRTNNSRNAIRNQFLESVSVHANLEATIFVQPPGEEAYEATLLGWDDYTIAVRDKMGHMELIWQGPGLRISPAQNTKFSLPSQKEIRQ